MTTPDQHTEAAIRAAGADVAPRVTPEDIEAAISSEHYFTAAEGCAGHCNMAVDASGWVQPLQLLTFCVLVLRNGFTVTGESACASPENFKPEIGRRIARENAVAKLWPLLGFRLRDHLAEQEAAKAMTWQDRVRAEKAELDERIAKLREFTGSEKFEAMSSVDRALLLKQLAQMLDYSDTLQARIEAFEQEAPMQAETPVTLAPPVTITPTVGRKVWYWPKGCLPDRVITYSADQPMDATIVYVWADDVVNLLVVDHAGQTLPVHSVTLRQPGTPEPGHPYAEWMPYQQGQARKEAAP